MVISLFPIQTSNKYTILFYKLLLGLVVTITLYSFIKTNGVTINSGFIFFGGLLLFLNRSKIDLTHYFERVKNYKPDIPLLASVFIFASLIFFWKYYCLFHNGQDFPIVINSDSIFHSNISIFLNSTGVESLNANFLYPPDGTHPYHYFEGWTIAFFSFLFNSNYWIIEESIVYPIFAAIVLTGTWALSENFIKLNFFTKLGGLITVFFSGFYFAELSEAWRILNVKETYTYAYNAIDEFWGLKLVVAYIFVIASFLLFIERKILTGIIVISMLPIVSITLAPGILASVSVFIVSMILFRKKLKIDYSISIYSLLIPFSVFVFIAFFYAFSGSSTEFITIPSSSNIITEVNSIAAIKNKITLFSFRIIQLLLLYSPVWIIMIISIFTSDKNTWREHFKKLASPMFLLGFVVIISLTISLLVSFAFGSKAYYFYTSLPFINILSVLLLIIAQHTIHFKILKWSVRIIIISFMIFFMNRTRTIYSQNKSKLWDQYSEDYIQEVYNLSLGIKNKIGGRIEGPMFFNYPIIIDNIDFLSPYTSGFNKKSNDSFILTSLSVIDITQKQLDNMLNKNYILTAPMYIFTKQLKKSNQFSSNENARLLFIKKNKIEYLLLNKDVTLDESIKPLVKKQIKDPKSGITFILIDPSKIY